MRKGLTLVTLLLVLIAATQVFAAPPGKVEVTFTYKPVIAVDGVNLAGNFNGWSPTKTKMTDKDGDGTYVKTLFLEPGKYQYKFVLNGETWKKPPEADDYVDDGQGGKNGVIYVKAGGALAKKSRQGDNKIVTKALYHNKTNKSYVNPMAKNKISIVFQAKENDLEEIILHYNDGQQNEIKMNKFLTSQNFDYYRTTIRVKETNFDYSFEVRDGTKTVWYDANGVVKTSKNKTKSKKQDRNLFSWLRNDDAEEITDEVTRPDVKPVSYNLASKEVFDTPAWVKDAVFYQIFPDRFYNGNPNNDPEKIEVYKDVEVRHDALIPDWDQGVPASNGSVLTDESQLSDNNNAIKPKVGLHVFYGGDLQGVEEKISYLKKLGINTIYFNPVFESTSNHKYNTAGYELIDDNLAIKDDFDVSNEYMVKLIKKLHDNGIRVIFDAVYNHVGYEHWAFQDVVKNGKDSEYADWFYINSYPVKPLYKQSESNPPNYEAWWGFGSLPKLNVNNQEVKDYLYQVTKKWMDPNGDGDPSDGVDGWRLDVANEVKDRNPEFWANWRDYVKGINSDAYITGEIWNDASDYLEGNEFDAVMNYRFREAVIGFIGRGEMTADKFASKLGQVQFDYPRQANYVLQNLIGSHDTKRYLTVINDNKDRMRLTSFLQMTYVGAPMIYYGDEVGMKGGEDPDDRRTMVWKDRGYTKPDKKLFNHYQKLIDIRKEEPALRRGNIERIDLDNKMVYAFKRSYKGEELLVFINAGNSKVNLEVPVDVASGSYQELYSGDEVKVETGKLQLKLDQVDGAIVKLK
ncbi:glycoside hydrolase family 13 protein [Halanaerocella petrolearia]